MTVSVKQSGTIKDPLEIFVKDSGTWKTVQNIYVNSAGTWKQAYPPTGTQAFTGSNTTHTFTVPQGVYSLNIDKMSGGGGGGSAGTNETGDCHSGPPGNAGSTLTPQSFAVTPGETLTLVTGAGGARGTYVFGRAYTGNAGSAGSATTISRGATTLFTVSGGAGGLGLFASGTNFTTPGKTNGTGYGTSGFGGCGCGCNGGAGEPGGIELSW